MRLSSALHRGPDECARPLAASAPFYFETFAFISLYETKKCSICATRSSLRTARERTRDAEREESAVLVVGEPLHLLLNQFEHLRRHEWAQRATDVVGNVRERKEAGDGEKNRMAGNRAREK
jgi:hypothetical protein